MVSKGGMWLVCVRYAVGMWLVYVRYAVGMWLVCGRYVVKAVTNLHSLLEHIQGVNEAFATDPRQPTTDQTLHDAGWLIMIFYL